MEGNEFDGDFSVDVETKKCQMKLTDQFIEQIVSKRSKKARLSRASSVVCPTSIPFSFSIHHSL